MQELGAIFAGEEQLIPKISIEALSGQVVEKIL